MNDLPSLLGHGSQLVTCLVVVVGAWSHFTRRRGDALPIEAKARELESKAEATNAETIRETLGRITALEDGRRLDRAEFEIRLRDSEAKCARDKAELQGQLIQWQQTAGENLAMLVARQDHAEQLGNVNSKLEKLNEMMAHGVELSGEMVAMLRARTQSEQRIPAAPKG